MAHQNPKPQSPTMRFFFAYLFPWPFLVAGLVLVGIGGRNIMLARASAQWPTTEGKIVHSSVDRRTNTGGSDSGPSTTYHAEVTYEYAVEGTTYTSSRVAFGDYGSSDSSHARRIVNRYPEGQQVPVHYDPADPEESVLEAGMKLQAWLLPGLGLLFLTAGVLMVVFMPMIVRRMDAAKQRTAETDDSELDQENAQ